MEHRKDMDQTVIRMGGRDFTAWALIQATALGAVGIALGVYGLAADVTWAILFGVVLIAIGIGTAFGR